MRKIAQFIGIAFLVGCSAMQQTGGIYTDPEFGYSVNVPSTWQQDYSSLEDSVIFVYINHEKEEFPSSVTVGVEQDVNDLNAYVQESLEAMQTGVEEFYELGAEETTLDGTQAHRREFQFALGEINLRGVQYTVVQGNKAYVLTYVGQEENTEQLLPIGEEIIASFTLPE